MASTGDGVIISAGRASWASGTLVCDTTVINKGRRVAALESEVRNGERLVAKALGTFAIFPQR